MEPSYLLSTKAGQELYQCVKELPVLDYHCHLSPLEIYEDKPFVNIGEIWLEHDHYKWRLMRAFGIDESYITGSASWRDKFQKYAETIALAAGNPLYHWTQMELSLFFGIDLPLDGQTAEQIWQTANHIIHEQQLSPRKLLAMSRVHYIATTDDIADTLEYHQKLRSDPAFDVTVAPSFRTDNLLLIQQQEYGSYISKLSAASGIHIDDLDSLLAAVLQRLDTFVENRCRFADVGIEFFPDHISTKEHAADTFLKALNRQPISREEFHGFLGFMSVFLAVEYRKHKLVMQWHLGVKRNANSELYRFLGTDCGGDCVGDALNGEHILRILDEVNSLGGLPTTILYTLNPSNAFMLSSIAGCFRNVHCGAAWWFCDNKRGIEEQLRIAAETGHLAAFVGMLTDSRSFLSYARHDYFRRILCDLIGQWVEQGEFADKASARLLVHKLCYTNARKIIEEGYL